ncbi:MAG: haloacid dehalogenase-like hydrolase, partial [Christensenellales bacterium]
AVHGDASGFDEIAGGAAQIVGVPDVEAAVSAFWQKNARRVRAWYQAQRREDDVIVSASPEFLLAPIAAQLGARLIASRVDPFTGQYDGENCHGAEKVRRFQAEFGGARPDAFYSDSLSGAWPHRAPTWCAALHVRPGRPAETRRFYAPAGAHATGRAPAPPQTAPALPPFRREASTATRPPSMATRTRYATFT